MRSRALKYKLITPVTCDLSLSQAPLHSQGPASAALSLTSNARTRAAPKESGTLGADSCPLASSTGSSWCSVAGEPFALPAHAHQPVSERCASVRRDPPPAPAAAGAASWGSPPPSSTCRSAAAAAWPSSSLLQRHRRHPAMSKAPRCPQLCSQCGTNSVGVQNILACADAVLSSLSASAAGPLPTAGSLIWQSVPAGWSNRPHPHYLPGHRMVLGSTSACAAGAFPGAPPRLSGSRNVSVTTSSGGERAKYSSKLASSGSSTAACERHEGPEKSCASPCLKARHQPFNS